MNLSTDMSKFVLYNYIDYVCVFVYIALLIILCFCVSFILVCIITQGPAENQVFLCRIPWLNK